MERVKLVMLWGPRLSHRVTWLLLTAFKTSPGVNSSRACKNMNESIIIVFKTGYPCYLCNYRAYSPEIICLCAMHRQAGSKFLGLVTISTAARSGLKNLSLQFLLILII